ncbi:delta-lactam-biosynthetic de-N-acetylase [Paenisporosarcina quisquiliarum]|uniref:Delta-lactam-biosynthetic de-N-acetylase n=1 Tax=Paenisporosarcina quisquiliarum TaxID=365346 RepID=A0A9X3RE02_9BACL|nr:delta-lactam-biosynthetic de-N-acetylase [Paenisporosarcina quisquiliarum]MCZ8536987.1 delta-lactam-biosynthetic de-N-acetylase [Paenisporosarcina quisquiliarum]
MIWKHTVGIIASCAILTLGILLNPFQVDAESLYWGFQKSKQEKQAQAGSAFDELLKKYGAYYKGSPDEKILYLTFDNGFENGYTASILDTLKKEKAPATFFLTGHYVESATDLVKRMVKEGHEIGNHSYGHPNMANLSEARMKEEWEKFDQILEEKTGVKKTRFARPPEGVFSEKLLAYGNELGYRHMFWSVAFVDWYADRPQGKEYAYNHLMNQLHPGAIILMHTVSPDNAAALPDFIRDAKAKGYTFSSLDALVNEATEFPLSFH